MLTICLVLVFFSVFSFVLGFMPLEMDSRPKLQLQTLGGGITPPVSPKKRKSIFKAFFSRFAVINKPLISPAMRKLRAKDLSIARADLNVEELFLIKELLVIFLMVFTFPFLENPDFFMFWILMCGAVGYFGPDFWLKGRVKKMKDSMVKELPDTVDLLGLCVNAGLDFMMALKYLIEKSPKTVVMDELSNMMQEINVGKPRRDALRDLARKYDLADLSTFSRTLIQADRMGTSVSEALNILSEDMREARFRRGEAMAMKAPLKMLVPLLFFIFPVVAVLVAGPIFLDFFQNNPFGGLAGGQ